MGHLGTGSRATTASLERSSINTDMLVELENINECLYEHAVFLDGIPCSLGLNMAT